MLNLTYPKLYPIVTVCTLLPSGVTGQTTAAIADSPLVFHTLHQSSTNSTGLANNIYPNSASPHNLSPSQNHLFLILTLCDITINPSCLIPLPFETLNTNLCMAYQIHINQPLPPSYPLPF